MLKVLVWLLCIGDATRMKTDSARLPRSLARIAHHTVQKIPTQSGLPGSGIVPATFLRSQLLHTSHGMGSPGSRDVPTKQSRVLQSRKFHAWSLNTSFPPEGFVVGETVQCLATNEEFVVKRVLGGAEFMECQRKRDNVVIWLRPEDVSHKLKIPMASQQAFHIRDPLPQTFHHGDIVIVITTGRQGQVWEVFSNGTDSEEDRPDLVSVDFLDGGVRSEGLYNCTDLMHA